jgi:hypothetical protein
MSQASRQKHRIWLIIAFLILGYAASKYDPNQVQAPSITEVFEQKKSDVQIEVSGIVSRLLPDDLKGSRHQRFIIQVDNISLLIAHNIDLAPKIDNINVGDKISVFGEYEWNSKGGVIHWTHHDPAHKHITGWIRHNGNQYQ